MSEIVDEFEKEKGEDVIFTSAGPDHVHATKNLKTDPLNNNEALIVYESYEVNIAILFQYSR